MKTEEKDEVLDIIKSYENFDFLTEIAKTNPDTKLDELFVIGFPLFKLINQVQRALIQLEAELNTDNYMYLPLVSNNDPALGVAFDLRTNLNNIRQHINDNDLNKFYGSLRNQVRYQIIWGFWDRSTLKIHNPNTNQINEATESLKISKKEIDRLQNQLYSKIKSVDEKKAELQSLIEQKRQELDFIGTKRDEINAKVTEANQLLININELKSQADGSKNLSNEYKDEVKRTLDEIKNSVTTHDKDLSDTKSQFKSDIKTEMDSFKEKKEELDEYITELENKDELYDKALAEITDDKNFIDTKRDEIIKLTGFAADSVLAHSFEKRAKQIEKNVTLWRNIAAVIIGLTVVWIMCLITDFFQNFHVEAKWDAFLVNFLKTSPFFVGLGFALTQYARERSLWEEYSFKAAVALTINPYADKLDGIADNELKKQLIVSSIMNVYSKPKGMYQKNDNPTQDGIKSVLSSIKGNGKE